MTYIQKFSGSNWLSRFGPDTQAMERQAAIRQSLLQLGLAGDDPCWSSELLDRLLASVMNTPGGCVNDLLQACNDILADFPGTLTKTKGHFIKDMVVQSFTQHRRSYETADWERLVHDLDRGGTEPQLYFALLAIPPQHLSASLARAIETGLTTPPFREEALNLLQTEQGTA